MSAKIPLWAVRPTPIRPMIIHTTRVVIFDCPMRLYPARFARSGMLLAASFADMTKSLTDRGWWTVSLLDQQVPQRDRLMFRREMTKGPLTAPWHKRPALTGSSDFATRRNPVHAPSGALRFAPGREILWKWIAQRRDHHRADPPLCPCPLWRAGAGFGVVRPLATADRLGRAFRRGHGGRHEHPGGDHHTGVSCLSAGRADPRTMPPPSQCHRADGQLLGARAKGH